MTTKPRAWLAGMLYIDTNSVAPEVVAFLQKALTLKTHDYMTDQVDYVEFYFIDQGWMYIPRGYMHTNEGKWFKDHFEIIDQRSIGVALPSRTRMAPHIQFGVPPYPKGQPQFIRDMVHYSEVTKIGGLAIAPTRSGKTLCAIAAAVALGRSTIILVDNVTIMDQWKKNIEENVVCMDGRPVACGVVQAENFQHRYPFVVATVQTLARRMQDMEFRNRYSTVLLDECQVAPSAQVFRALRVLNARHVIGLTATPRRGDGTSEAIKWLIGPQIAKLERTIKADCRFIHYPYNPNNLYKTDPKTGNRRKCKISLYRKGRVDTNKCARAMFSDPDFVSWLADHVINAMQYGRHVIVMVKLVDNLRALAQELRDKGVQPGLFYGSMRGEEVAAAMRTNPCIVTYAKASKGVDFKPPPTAFFLAVPCSDPEQAIGRGLQPQANVKPMIIDVVPGARAMVKLAQRRVETYKAKKLDIKNEPWPFGWELR